MYRVMSSHYDGPQRQIVSEHKRRWQAERKLLQTGEILKGYYRRTGMVEGTFIVFGDEDIHVTRLWVERAK